MLLKSKAKPAKVVLGNVDRHKITVYLIISFDKL